jgi:hypothetical protein
MYLHHLDEQGRTKKHFFFTILFKILDHYSILHSWYNPQQRKNRVTINTNIISISPKKGINFEVFYYFML